MEIVLAIIISFVIALVIVSILKAGMKNVSEKSEAGNYVSQALNLTHHADRFTHKTTSQRKIETSSAPKT